MREGCLLVEVLIESNDIAYGRRCFQRHHLRAEDSSCEVATVGDEIHSDAICLVAFIECVNHMGRTCGLQLVQRLANLMQVLVCEELIDREIVVSPREMCGRSRLLTCSCRTSDGVHGNVLRQQASLCQRQQA